MNLKSNIEKNIKHYVVVTEELNYPFCKNIRIYENKELSKDEIFETNKKEIIKKTIYSFLFYLMMFIISCYSFSIYMFDSFEQTALGLMLSVAIIFSGLYIIILSMKFMIYTMLNGFNKNVFKNYLNIYYEEKNVIHQFLIEDRGVVLNFHFEEDDIKKIVPFQKNRIESVASLISFFEKINGMNIKSNVESVSLINTKTLYIKTKDTEKSKFIFQKLNLEADIKCNGDYIKIDLIDEKDPCKIVKIDEIGKE